MLSDAATVLMANALDAAVTHMAIHSAAPGAAGTTAVVGSRVAVNGTVDGDGDITWTAAFTGLPANQPVTHVSYWSSATGGTFYGSAQIPTDPPNDTTANAAGAITVTAVENSQTS